MAININPPSRPQGSAAEQLERLYSYLFRMTEELNMALSDVETSGREQVYKAIGGGAKSSGGVPKNTVEAYQQLKALIVKTATEVTSNVRKVVTEITQEYMAESEFGTYSEYLNALIEASAGGLAATWDAENKLVVPQSGVFSEYTAVSQLYMKLGIVGENEDGTLEAGVVIGKDLQKVTVDGVDYITSKDVYSLLTADSLSFWQDGRRMSKISLTDFFVGKAYIEEVTAEIINTEELRAAIVAAVEAQFDSIVVDDLIDANVVRAAAVEAVAAEIGKAVIKDAQIESVDGAKIKAGTITADKVDIASLFAAQATINALVAADISGNQSLKLAVKGATDRADAQVKELQSQIKLLPGQIELAVQDIDVGGTQLLRDTQQLTVGTDVDRWRVSGCEIIPAEDEFNAIRLNRAGLTENGWTVAMSPLTRLQDGWADRELTLSAWVYSPNWAAVDANVTWMVALSPGTASWPVYWAKVINVPGKVELNSAATSNAPLVNNKWARVSVKFQMSSASFAGGGVFADCTHMHVQFRLNKNGDVRLYGPKLEFGNKATDWSPYPEEFRAGSNVLITKDEVKISTPEFNVDIVGADGETNMLSIDENGAQMRSLTAPDVAPRYAGPATLYVNPAATPAQIAAGNYYRSLADALAALSNRWVGYDVTVNLTAGMTEYGRCVLSGTAGKGVIYIRGNASNRAKLVGGLNVHFSGCAAVISNVNIDTGSGASAIDCAGAQTFVIVENCILTGAGTSQSVNGMWSRQGAKVDIHTCEIYDFNAAVKAEQTGAVQIYSCKGNCYIRNNMGTIYATGSMPSGGTAFDAEVWGGALHTSGITVDQGSKPTPTPAPTTSTVTANATRSYTTAWRQGDTEIRQGYYSGMGEWAGCMWFPTASFSGKTIKTASLTLTRQNGSGKGSAVSLKLYGIKIASASGNPLTNAVSYDVIGTIENGETKTFTLPTAAGQALANGTIKGFMLYAGDGKTLSGKSYSTNYCKVSSNGAAAPKLTITY